jgi:hypothetical protein
MHTYTGAHARMLCVRARACIVIFFPVVHSGVYQHIFDEKHMAILTRVFVFLHCHR